MGILDKAKEAKARAADKASELRESAANKASELRESAANKATELRESAANKASELRESAANKASELRESAANKAQELRDGAANKINDVVDGAIAKVKESLAEFNAALPIISAIGYSVGSVKIELGVSPKIVAAFKSTGAPISDEIVEQVTTVHQDNKLAVMMVKSLYHARMLQESIEIGGLKPKGIAIQIGLLPTVSVEFG